jgi:hypothetical protein
MANRGGRTAARALNLATALLYAAALLAGGIGLKTGGRTDPPPVLHATLATPR